MAKIWTRAWWLHFHSKFTYFNHSQQKCHYCRVNADLFHKPDDAVSVSVSFLLQIKRVKDADEVPMVCKYPVLCVSNLLLLHMS